jgi:hypothetical protein
MVECHCERAERHGHMTPQEKRQALDLRLQAVDEIAVVMDGFDDAILGIATQFTNPPMVVYSRRRVIEILEEQMSPEEAMEHLVFNIIGSWVGQQTPLLFDPLDEEWLTDAFDP